MSTTPQWSIITVTYNNADKLASFWGGWEPDQTIAEWIVVDNHSTDGSAAIAAGLGARVIELPQNKGFGAANNVGFRTARGDSVAFVNPDVRVELEGLSMLDAHLEAHPRALVSPQLLNHDGSLQPNGRGLPYLANKVRNRTAPAELIGTYLRFANPGQTADVEWLMGAVVAGRHDHLARLGPWDERFFVYYEDADLGLRNTRAGGRNTVVGDVTWLHGWARETSSASFSAWKRELPSMAKFYSRYPALLGVPRPPKGAKA